MANKVNDLFTPKKRETAVDIVINTIKELILRKELKSGDRLPSESELADNLKISRGSIREAMKILSAFGVVNIKRGNGTYIADSLNKEVVNPLIFSLILTDADTKELVELRQLMEFEVVRLIIKNAEKDDLELLEKTYLRMENIAEKENVDNEALVEYDVEFHKIMGYATKNKLVQKIYEFVLDFFKPYIKKTYDTEEINAPRLHKDILDALLERDLDKSIKAINDSIIFWQKFL